MLRHVLGDANFWAALGDYRAAFEGSAATTEDFQAICQQYYPGGDLEWFFNQWIYLQGAPSYSWGWSTALVNGRRYLLVSVDQTQQAMYPRFAMPIDIVADGTTHVIFNDTDTEQFVIPVEAAPTTVTFDPDAWILWGTRTSGAYVPGPPKIVETSPAPGSYVQAVDGVSTVSIYFQAPASLNATDATLVGDVHGNRAFTLTSGTNANPVVLNLAGPLPRDFYTLTVSDAVVSSLNSIALDGEMVDSDDAASLPSGDGSPGGAAVIRFGVGPGIPAVSTWGLMVLALLVSIGGTAILRGRAGHI
jgi:hypothetical protein